MFELKANGGLKLGLCSDGDLVEDGILLSTGCCLRRGLRQ